MLSGKNKVIANDKVEGKGHMMTSGDLSYFKKVLTDMESYKPQQKDAEKEKRDKKKKKSKEKKEDRDLKASKKLQKRKEKKEPKKTWFHDMFSHFSKYMDK